MRGAQMTEAMAAVRDPVCGKAVDPATARYVAVHDGAAVYFCSAGCKAKFEAEPERYLGARPAPPPAPEGTIYTCPMHPEIEQAGPGACPICGMARCRSCPPPMRGRTPSSWTSAAASWSARR